jgi:hypothetical protein
MEDVCSYDTCSSSFVAAYFDAGREKQPNAFSPDATEGPTRIEAVFIASIGHITSRMTRVGGY